MTNFDIINNNLIYKDQYVSYVFTNKNVQPVIGRLAMIRITDNDEVKYLAYGKIVSKKMSVITVKINNEEQNKIFPEPQDELKLVPAENIRKELEFFVNDAPLELNITLYKIGDRKSLLPRKVLKICNSCKITLGMKQFLPECSLSQDNSNLGLLANRQMQPIPEDSFPEDSFSQTNTSSVAYDQILQEPLNLDEIEPLIEESEYSVSQSQQGSAKQKKRKNTKNKKNQNTKIKICGKKTKSGKICKIKGKCPYH